MHRTHLVTSALRLSVFTIAWNGVVGALALVVSVLDDSPALAGFALNALLDSSASGVLVWRFSRERRDPVGAERLERHAQYGVAAAMVSSPSTSPPRPFEAWSRVRIRRRPCSAPSSRPRRCSCSRGSGS